MYKKPRASFFGRLKGMLYRLSREDPGKDLASHHSAVFNRQVFRTFIVMRYIILVLSSLAYLLGPFPSFSFQKLLIVVGLFALAFSSNRIYQAYQKKMQAVKMLAFAETLGITALVLFTGALESPFVWYILSPLVLSSMHLHAAYTWSFLGLFLSGGILGDSVLTGVAPSIEASALAHAQTILLLVLLTLFAQVFARIYYTLAEQSQRLEIQQEELVDAYIDLSENHQVMQTLSDYQRDIVACKNERDIYSRLVAACTFAFPFDRTSVLMLQQPLYRTSTQPFGDYELISDAKTSQKRFDKRFEDALVDELRYRWQEFFSSQGFMVGGDRSWLAVPIRLDKNVALAVLVGQSRDLGDLKKLKENLSFYIQFTEQVIQSLRNLHQTEETLQHISNIYEAVETISRRDDPREILDLFSSYARSLTGCEKIIFWVEQLGSEQIQPGTQGDGSIYSVKGKSSVFPEESWQKALLRAWSEIKDNPVPLVQLIEDNRGRPLGQMVCVPVKSWARCFGIMAALHTQKNYNKEEIQQKLTFLSRLSAVAIERNITELFADKLMLLEEQKRISNEIHDSISQNLFSIVYGLESISKRSEVNNSVLKDQVIRIKDVASHTAKELRFLIYRLSPRKRGDETFVRELRDYLSGLANINDIVIDFDVQGTEENLNEAMRNAFYRIIKEATGNAIRHGHCGEIKIKLDMTPFTSSLKIEDDGVGFDIASLEETPHSVRGLGITNMRELTHSLQGEFAILSTSGEGTLVSCQIPTYPAYRGQAIAK